MNGFTDYSKLHPYKRTRQQARARLFAGAFAEITSKFGGESRRVRRSMARAKANREYREGWAK